MNVFGHHVQIKGYLNAIMQLVFPSVPRDQTPADSSGDTLGRAVDSISTTLSTAVVHSQHQADATDAIEMVLGAFVPIAFVVVAGILIWKRLETRKAIELAMIEKGLDPRGTLPDPDSTRKFRALRFGLLLVGVGLGLCMAMIVWNVFDWAIAYDYRPLVALTSVTFFSGLALTVYHIIATSLENR